MDGAALLIGAAVRTALAVHGRAGPSSPGERRPAKYLAESEVTEGIFHVGNHAPAEAHLRVRQIFEGQRHAHFARAQRRLQRGESLSMPQSRAMPSIAARCHEKDYGEHRACRDCPLQSGSINSVRRGKLSRLPSLPADGSGAARRRFAAHGKTPGNAARPILMAALSADLQQVV